MSEQREAFEACILETECLLMCDEDVALDIFIYAWNAALASAPSAEPAGMAGTMPGTSGYTMACFTADDIPAGTLLYTAPPNLSAAVAAAREQDARVCDQVEAENIRSNVGGYAWEAAERIRALQTEDGLAALREFGLRVAMQFRDYGARYSDAELAEIVSRVMKGE